MRHFGYASFNLRNSPPTMKLIITAFLSLMLIGYLLNLIMTFSTVGITAESAKSYYLGSESEMAFPKTFRQLLEVAHFHLFMMPLILLTVSHLFLFTSWSERRKLWFVGSAFLAMGAQILLPWLIRYGHYYFAYLKAPADVVMTVSFLTLVGLPLLEMWLMKKTSSKG